MSDKQDLFVIEYLKDLNATQAAIRAGYSEKTAYSIAHTLLKHLVIQEKIQKKIKERKEKIAESDTIKIDPSVKEVLIKTIGEDNISDFVDHIILNYLNGQDLEEIIKRRRRTITKELKYSLLERAGFKCQACGERPLKDNDVILQIDHIIPFSMGGGCSEDNLQVLCRDCNLSKSNGYIVDHNEANND